MPTVRVIGCGNPGAGDDDAGLAAVRLAREALERVPDVDVVLAGTAVGGLDLIPGARAVEVGGVVQGVGFRPFVWRLAHRYGVRGWVRNRSGVVEILAEGAEDALAGFCAALSAEAPPRAQVESMHVAPAPAAGTEGFE